MSQVWSRHVIYCLVFVLFLFLLSGCGEAEDRVTVVATEPTLSEETAVITPTPSPNPTSTVIPYATPTSQPVENTPIPTVVTPTETTAPLDACVDTTLAFENSAKATVRWRLDDAGEIHCCQVNSIYQMSQNPDPASHLALFSVIMDDNVPGYSDNVLVDLSSGAFKILGHGHTEFPRYLSAWLPEGKIVWADDKGEVYLGSLETEESLDAPAKMTDLWFVPPDRILARDEAYQFWYFDLTTSVWSQLPVGESEKITWRWIENAAVSDAGDYVFFFFVDYTAILSNESGTIQTVTPQFDSEDKYYVVIDAVEGDTFSPPQQIQDTPYWFFTPHWIFREFAQISYPVKGFVVNSGTGEVVEYDILGIPADVAIYNSYLSLDEMWVAVEVVENIQSLETYPAQVSQTWFISLTTGEKYVEDGAFAGWGAENEDYLHAPLSCAYEEIVIELSLLTKE